jgi:hypothetical protein
VITQVGLVCECVFGIRWFSVFLQTEFGAEMAIWPFR